MAQADGATRLNQHVVVGRRKIDMPFLEPLTLPRMQTGQRSNFAEAFGKKPRAGGRYMQHDQKDSVEIRRQAAEKPLERLDPTGGGADDDHTHVILLSRSALLFEPSSRPSVTLAVRA